MSDKKPTGLELMRAPFPEHQISLLPKPTKKDAPKGNCKECGGYHGLPAIHLSYVGHAALTDRLLDVDPSWVWEPLHTKDGLPAFDLTGGLWIKLTVCGVTRLGYGNAEPSNYKDVGSREKEVIGDALRNAAMRFGAALDLWHKGDLHLDDTTEKETPDLKVVQEKLPPQWPAKDIKITNGKFAGKKLSEISKDEAEIYIEEIMTALKTAGKKEPKWFSELKAAAGY